MMKHVCVFVVLVVVIYLSVYCSGIIDERGAICLPWPAKCNLPLSLYFGFNILLIVF